MSAPAAPRLSVLIPCYNEAATIEAIVRKVVSAPFPGKEIIVVDDGSTDGTRDILRTKIEPMGVRVILQEKNRGKGAALREAFRAATGDVWIVQDADLEYDPADYERIVRPILEGKADVVYGSRFVGSESHRIFFFWHSLGNRFLTFLSNLFSNMNLTDMETGYKVFRREIGRRIEIEENRFGFEPEITAKVAKLGCRIYEVGISYAGRTYAEGKKIGWRDGLRAIWCILKYNLRRRPRSAEPTPAPPAPAPPPPPSEPAA
ncbi:MAG: glycosyltransferase family 2 protein [Planctomycetota bacterium]